MPDYKRKLAAIFSADVAGYSRLMEDDEAATVNTLTEYREVLYLLIRQHRGRVIDSPGDNLLAEFASVVDAAQCSVAIQKELKSRNSELPENRRMQFRIGINLGDVIEEDERIYGDGVNIAARLEALADPGGICISKTAFDHIESKLPLGYEFIGEQSVKNIERPVFAYKVIMEPRVVTASIIKKVKNKSFWTTRNLAVTGGTIVLLIILLSVFGIIPRCSDHQTERSHDQRPSVVVLPFKNISGVPAQETFSDGITEELIHSLARIKGLKVVSSTSSFYYKGKDMPLSTMGEELSVNYALEGSVKKDDKKFLIYAQLISVADDNHILSLKYNREMKDIFNIQEEISKAVASELKVELVGTEYEKIKETAIVGDERRMGINVIVDDDEIIRGGLLAIGANINMEGSVKGGLRAYGGHVIISGTSQDRVDFLAGDVTLSGNFKDNVRGTTGNLIITGTFDKDLTVDAKHITLTSTAVIKGDFKYTGVLERKDGSQVAGKITKVDKVNTAPESFSNIPQEKSILMAMLGKIYWDVNVIIFGIFIYFFFPKQNEKILSVISASSFSKTIWKGLLFIIASTFIIIICVLSFIGIPFGCFYAYFFTTIIFLGPVFGNLWVGRKLLSFIKVSIWDNFFISLITGIIVIEVLSVIPYVGWLAKAVPFLVGISATWQVVWAAIINGTKWASDNNIKTSGMPDQSLSGT